MKKRVGIVLVFCIGYVGTVHSEEKTLFKHGEITHGWFGGPWLKFSPVNDEFGIWVGARGGWTLNSVLSVGGGGYGLANNVKADNPDTVNLMIGVGGFITEVVFFSDELVHGTFSLLIGAGGMMGHGMRMSRSSYHADGGHVFVLEPEFNLEINITRFLRLCPGVSYHWFSGDVDAVESAWDISGPSANLMIKFGLFSGK